MNKQNSFRTSNQTRSQDQRIHTKKTKLDKQTYKYRHRGMQTDTQSHRHSVSETKTHRNTK